MLETILKKNRWLIFALASLLIWLLYTLTNRLTYHEGHGGPSLPLDEMIPLIPASIWIYGFYYLIVVFSWHLMRDFETGGRFLALLLVVNVVSNMIFVFWPTSFPRQALPADCQWILNSCAAFQVIHFFDTPANCFPSLHVSMSWLAALIWWKKNRQYMFWLSLWALVISVSTLTTKQHYLMDVMAGAGLTACVLFFEKWLFPGKRRGPAGQGQI